MKELLIAMAMLLVTLWVVGGTIAQDSPAKVRVGVYDNRVIAVAFGNSDYLPVKEKKAELKQAKADGDSARVAELEAWGQKYQRQLHRQGFCRVPVDDLLAYVQDKMPDLAQELKVDVITMHCDFTGDNVEVVDINRELAALFLPSEQALSMIDEIMQHQPVDLDDLEHDH